MLKEDSALFYFEVGVVFSTLVNKMHNPETKSIIFQKNSPAAGNYILILRIKCLLWDKRPQFYIEYVDIILLGMRILVQFLD